MAEPIAEPLTGPLAFLAGGALVSGAGLYVLARGPDATRRVAVFHLYTVLGIWSIVSGSVLSAGAAETARFWATAACVLALLVITLAYRVAVRALDVERQGRPALRVLAGLAVVAGLLAATGPLELVDVRPTAAGSGSGPFTARLRWPAVLLLAATLAGVGHALRYTWRRWRAEHGGIPGTEAAWIAFGLVGSAGVLLHYLPVEGFGSRPVGTMWGGAGILALTRAAWRERRTASRTGAVASAVLADASSPLLLCRRDGTVRSVSRAFTRAFGYDGSLVGRKIFALLEDPAQDSMVVRRILAHGFTPGATPAFLVRTAAGERFLVHMDAARLGHVEGESVGIVAILGDLRDREAADEELEKFHRCFRNPGRERPVSLAVARARDGLILEANDELLDLTGLLRQELDGKTLSDVGLVRSEGWSDLLERAGCGEWREEMSADLPARGTGGVRWGQARLCCRNLRFRDQDCLLVVAQDMSTRDGVRRMARDPDLYDPVTGLPRQLLFRQRLKQALESAWRDDHRVGVLVIELAESEEEDRRERGALDEDEGDERARRLPAPWELELDRLLREHAGRPVPDGSEPEPTAEERDSDEPGMEEEEQPGGSEKEQRDEHEEGLDGELLTTVADRMLECFRSRDTVSRHGPHSFVVVLEELRSANDARIAARRFVEEMESPVRLSDRTVRLEASVGIVVAGPGKDELRRRRAARTREDRIGLGGPSIRERPDVAWSSVREARRPGPGQRKGAEDVDRLLERADAAMQRAKLRGGGIEMEGGSGA